MALDKGIVGRKRPRRGGLCWTYDYSTSSSVWQDSGEVSMIAASWKDPTNIPQWRTWAVNSRHPHWYISYPWALVAHFLEHPPSFLSHRLTHKHTQATLYNWLWKDIRLITLFPWGRRDPVTVRRKTKQRDGKIEQNKRRRADSRCVIRINGGEMKGS